MNEETSNKDIMNKIYLSYNLEDITDDIDFQRTLGGQIVREEIEDSFCYVAGECQRVSEGEMEIVQAQRNRISFEKISHLQDEIFDIITIPHLFTGENINVLITNLTRSYTVKGPTIDRIEGWRI